MQRAFVRLVCVLVLGTAAIHAATAKLKVVASFLPAYCLAVQVGGEHAEVQCLAGGANDAHDLQLSPREIRHLRDAKLLIVNGLQLEKWVGRILISLPNNSPTVVELSAKIGEQMIRGPTSFRSRSMAANTFKQTFSNDGSPVEPAPNPHFWLGQRLMMIVVTNLVIAFSSEDISHASDYARNGALVTARLTRLDDRLRAQLDRVKATPFVTQHDAFAYFARRYELNLVGVLESIPNVEPTPRYLEQLLAVMREHRVRVLFVAPRSPSRLADQLAKDNHLQTGLLDPLETGELNADAYDKGMERNVHELTMLLK